MDRLREYFRSKGNITGFLPRWVFLVIGLGMLVFQWLYYPTWQTVVLVGLAVVIFFAVDFFALSLIAWWERRK